MASVDIATESVPFAMGRNRFCFFHPENRRRCIKILRPEASPHVKRAEKKIYRRMRPLRYFDANYKEFVACHRIEKYCGEALWEHIARCYGFINTSIGVGLCSELICDSDQRISLNLKQYLWVHGYTDELRRAFHTFETHAVEDGLPSRMLDPLNIAVQMDRERIRRVVLVDGIGWPQLFPMRYFVRSWAREGARVEVNALRARMERVLANKAAGRDFGIGWLDEAQRCRAPCSVA